MSEPEVTEADREKGAAVWQNIVHRYWTPETISVLHPRLTEAIAAALAAERAKAREPFLRLIENEAAEAQGREHYAITVEVPMAVGTETIDRIFDTVADAAHDAEPEERDWDVFIHGCGPTHQGVPLHFIRRAAEESQ